MFESAVLKESEAATATVDVGGVALAVSYGDTAAEIAAAETGAAIFDRADRTLIRITGDDRASWLHNLVTNAVNDVAAGTGHYSFACDVQGRIQFDLIMLVAADAILLDVQRDLAPTILAHFDRFLITEDVTFDDLSNHYTRIDCLGPNAQSIADSIAFAPASLNELSDLAHVHDDETESYLVRISRRGLEGFSLLLPQENAAAHWQNMIDMGATPAGWAAYDFLRTRAGLPRFGQDFTTKSLPAETGQLDRAVSFHKGCYLGQEVVERMRSRGALARRFVGVALDSCIEAAVPSELSIDDKAVGSLTSLCATPDDDGMIGLATIRTSAAADVPLAIAGQHVAARIRELPATAESA